MKKISILLTFFISFPLLSCSSPLIYTSGIKNLDEIQNNIIIGKSNFNDVRSLLGEALIKEYPNEKNWIYIESAKQKNLFGNTTTIKNIMLVLFFDSKGILLDKELLTLKDVKNLEFETEETKTLSIDNNFSNKFFASMRKRMRSRAEQKTNIE